MGEMTVGQRWWQRARMVAIVAVLSLLSLNASSGETPTPTDPITGGFSEEFWRWLATQGGLTVALLALGWSYRRDLRRWADERARLAEERASERNELRVALERSAQAMQEHAVAVARNTDSTHRLANAVEKLDGRLERVEHRE